jgi:hypothetical protein
MRWDKLNPDKPIIIRRSSDFGFAIYLNHLNPTYPLYRETARGILTMLRTMLKRRLQ